MDGYKNLTYTERLQSLDLPTLAYRRARGDMIEMYKHFNIIIIIKNTNSQAELHCLFESLMRVRDRNVTGCLSSDRPVLL